MGFVYLLNVLAFGTINNALSGNFDCISILSISKNIFYYYYYYYFYFYFYLFFFFFLFFFFKQKVKRTFYYIPVKQCINFYITNKTVHFFFAHFLCPK